MELFFLALLLASVIAYIFIKKNLLLAPAPAALVALILELCSAHPVAVWVTLGVLLIAALIVLLVYGKKDSTSADFRCIVGSRCRVIVEVDNYAGRGEVSVRGQIWAARAVSDEEIYDVGETLSIVAIEGVKLVCRK